MPTADGFQVWLGREVSGETGVITDVCHVCAVAKVSFAFGGDCQITGLARGQALDTCTRCLLHAEVPIGGPCRAVPRWWIRV